MVWVNPVTGVRSFRVLPDAVRKFYLKTKVIDEEEIIEDAERTRVFLNDIIDQVLRAGEYCHSSDLRGRGCGYV
jgi:hypothetical protein